jgi:hypothetical protein
VVLRRVLESVPATLLAGTVVLVVVLFITAPTALVLLASGYVVFWGLRSTEMGVRQLAELVRLRRYERVDWAARLHRLTDPYAALQDLAARPRLRPTEAAELRALRDWVHSGADVPAPADLHHLVVIPVTDEAADVLHGTLAALAAAEYPLERLVVCLSFEARSGRWTAGRAAELCAPYESRFGLLLTTWHPDGRPGERRVKGANITWGARVAVKELRRHGLRDSQVVVSALDSDTQVSRHYFQVLSYTYLTDPDRNLNGYQPVLLFHNNVWDVPAASRLVGYIAGMWTLVDSTRPERIQLFSSHAIGLPALLAVNYWATDVIPDDSRQHWRLYFNSRGRSHTVALHVAVRLDAVQARGLRATLIAQYRQIRRWAYGVVDFPYMMEQNLVHPEVPLGTRIHRTVRQLLQFYLWASVPLLLLASRPVLAWLTPALAPASITVSLAHRAVTLSPLLALASLALSMVVALTLLPARPAHREPAAWIAIVAEWLLLPVVVVVFLCLPAIDAQVRLLTGRYLGFRVTPKRRLRPAAGPADAVDAAY